MIPSKSNAVLCSHGPFPGVDTPCRVLIVALLVLFSIAFSACGVRSYKVEMSAQGSKAAPILLFDGTGTSPGDVAAIETILNSNHLNYSTVNSSQLNEMSEPQIRAFSLLIIPGGNFLEMGHSLTLNTATNIRNAVQSGSNYLGICGGAFLAGDSTYYNGLNLTSGVKFGFYAAEKQGTRKAAVPIAVAGGPTLEQYWEDGPQFTGWGAVVGTYPDGTPAIVEGTFGRGWVLLTGVHPEAPASWRQGMSFNTPVSEDNAYAGTLINAALNRTSLSHH